MDDMQTVTQPQVIKNNIDYYNKELRRLNNFAPTWNCSNVDDMQSAVTQPQVIKNNIDYYNKELRRLNNFAPTWNCSNVDDMQSAVTQPQVIKNNISYYNKKFLLDIANIIEITFWTSRCRTNSVGIIFTWKCLTLQH